MMAHPSHPPPSRLPGPAPQPSRRAALQLAAAAAAAPLLLRAAPALAADKAPGGFVLVRDQQDAYQFAYPFGWQEVQVEGQDVVFKDVIEPLESVSVNMVPTDKADITEFGDVKEVTFTLADKVLTSPRQEVNLVAASQRVVDGRPYYDFEFTARSGGAGGYTRHAAGSVTVANGKFYTLVTGSNEKRWGRMSGKVARVVQSFTVSTRYD